MIRYTLYQMGPDDSSTYAECWGFESTSRGQRIATACTLVCLMDAVGEMDHDNWWICGPDGKKIAGSRQEYYALTSIEQAMKKGGL